MTASKLSTAYLHDEAAALARIEAALWPDGPVCPHCGATDRIYTLEGKSTRPGLRKCGHCRKPFTVTIDIECKNVLGKLDAAKRPKLDFQRTRASKRDACSRYYAASDFHIVAACLQPVRGEWDFAFRLTREMERHPDPACAHKLSHNVRIDEPWSMDLDDVLRRV